MAVPVAEEQVAGGSGGSEGKKACVHHNLVLNYWSWSLLLPCLSLQQWWRLRDVSRSLAKSILPGIRDALQGWPLDPGHPHGGPGGMQLTAAVQGMIRWGATLALTVTCEELRRRQAAQVPWLLRSRELAMYAAGHAETAASLELLLSLAPHAAGMVCRHRGFTLLHEAAFCRKPKSVKALLAMRCDARAQNAIGETALHIACHGHCPRSLEIAELLLEHDQGLVHLVDEAGLSPAERTRDAQRRWRALIGQRRRLEEESAFNRLLEALQPRPAKDMPASEELQQQQQQQQQQPLPRCGSCGMRAGRRRTRDGRSFCASCGVLR